MGIVCRLEFEEATFVDAERVCALVGEFGALGAERMLVVAVAEITAQIGAMEAALESGDACDLTHCAAVMAALARQIGMPSLARIGGDLVACQRRGDLAALAATRARLLRQAESLLPEAPQFPLTGA